MPISDEHKLIFIHIPKNAGTSIKEALGMSMWGHETSSNIRRKNPQIWQKYFKFCVVRNPWDRAVSCYEFSRMDESFWHTRENRAVQGRSLSEHPDYKLLSGKTFKEAMLMLENGDLTSQHWNSQVQYIYEGKILLVDEILRQESLGASFGRMLKAAGVSGEHALPLINQSNRLGHKKYYDEQTVQIVSKVYAKDIEAFKYEF